MTHAFSRLVTTPTLPVLIRPLLAVWLLILVAPPAGLAGACLDPSPVLGQARQAEDPGQERHLAWVKQVIEEEFPLDRSQALETLRQAYPLDRHPEIDDAFLEEWLDNEAMCAVIAGKRRYFNGVAKNLAFRTFPLVREEVAKRGQGNPFVDQAGDLVFPRPGSGFPVKDWQPYSDPVRYLFTQRVDIPRDRLPATGRARLFLPLPIATSSQQAVRVVDVSPAEFLLHRPRTDAELGLAVLDFDLAGLENNLNASASVVFTSYTQRFRIDPEAVRPCDQNSPEYLAYTAAGNNIALTPAIRAMAREASRGEENPYLAARNLYRHLMENIRYSYLPHGTLMALGIPESVFVHERGYGDCGAQSMYFAALCRSLGIPARATGGYQLFPGLDNTHFWAEFYLEGYGWVPVDPTVADAADWTGEITESQRQAFKDFYFGNLDPYRMVIQLDVDRHLRPRPAVNWLTGRQPVVAIQSPWLECPGCQENPVELAQEHFTWRVIPLDH